MCGEKPSLTVSSSQSSDIEHLLTIQSAKRRMRHSVDRLCRILSIYLTDIGQELKLVGCSTDKIPTDEKALLDRWRKAILTTL